MKYLFLITISILISSIGHSQSIENKTLLQLTDLKNKAVAEENYTLASKYKKAIEIRIELDASVKAGDYEKAATLKKQLLGLNGETSTTEKPAAESSVGSEVEFVNVVYLHNNRTGENIKLEQQDATIGVESYSAVYVAGSTSYWNVEGYYSPVQISGDDDFTFYVKMGPGVDPASIFTLVRLKLGGKEKLKRKQIVSKTTAVAYGGARSQSNFGDEVPVSFRKTDDTIYEIVLDQMLLPGEYAFKMGVKWFLFGVQNRVSNNPDALVVPNVPENINIYHLSADAPNIAWLGIDCSLYRFRSDYNVGRENQVKEILLDGITYNTKNYIVQKKVESWLSKENRIDYLPQFGYDITLKELDGQWIIPRSQEYFLSREQIEDHIKEYKINAGGIGMVEIAEITDREENEYRGYIVLFDFDTREILELTKLTVGIKTGKKPTERDFAAEFLNVLKVYVDKHYKRKM